MANRGNPNPKGSKPDKLMRDAISRALHEEAMGADGKPTKKLNLVAIKLVDKAIAGDVGAINVIADRMDGRPTQELDVKHEGEITFRQAAISALDELIAGATRRAADSAGKSTLPN